jgi:hypothetical protein
VRFIIHILLFLIKKSPTDHNATAEQQLQTTGHLLSALSDSSGHHNANLRVEHQTGMDWDIGGPGAVENEHTSYIDEHIMGSGIDGTTPLSTNGETGKEREHDNGENAGDDSDDDEDDDNDSEEEENTFL